MLDDQNINVMYVGSPSDFPGSVWSTANLFKDLRPSYLELGMVALWSNPCRGNVTKKNTLTIDPLTFACVFWNRDTGDMISSMAQSVADKHNLAVKNGQLRDNTFMVEETVTVDCRKFTHDEDFASSYEVRLTATNFAFCKRTEGTGTMSKSDVMVQLRVFFYHQESEMDPRILASKPLRPSTNAYFAYQDTWSYLCSSTEIREFLAPVLFFLKGDPQKEVLMKRLLTDEEMNAKSPSEMLAIRFGEAPVKE